MSPRTLVVALPLSFLLFAACGGSTDDGAGVGQSGTTGGAAGAGAGAAGSGTAGTVSAGTAGTGTAGTSSGGTSSSGSAGKNACAGCKGCCTPDGECRPGDQAGACGLGGVVCTACDALGFACQAGKCAGTKPVCDAKSCAGCCDASGNCQVGTATNACGKAGDACTNCGEQGAGCVSGACEGPPPACSPKTCGGCCDAQGNCQTGNTTSACGIGGGACAACPGANAACVSPGSYCAYFPGCGSQSCPGCCDAKGVCQGGKTDAQCGANGGACSDCGASGLGCATQGFCYKGPHCGPDNCGGCCTAAGECKSGNTSAACGQFGALCNDCGADACTGFACKTADTCPSTYAGCSPAAATTPPKLATACDTATLDALQAACKGAMGGPSCGAFFQKLMQSDASCFDCITQFAGDDAFLRCLAPFLDPSCNHLSTCAVSCGTTCDGCDPSAKEVCNNVQFSPGGACGPYLYGYYCITAAMKGPAAFCSFDAAGNDVGTWIRTVAGHYCAK